MFRTIFFIFPRHHQKSRFEHYLELYENWSGSCYCCRYKARESAHWSELSSKALRFWIRQNVQLWRKGGIHRICGDQMVPGTWAAFSVNSNFLQFYNPILVINKYCNVANLFTGRCLEKIHSLVELKSLIFSKLIIKCLFLFVFRNCELPRYSDFDL